MNYLNIYFITSEITGVIINSQNETKGNHQSVM